MEISYENGTFIGRCKFEDRIKFQRAGFIFNPVLKRYETSNFKTAFTLREYFTDGAKSSFSTCTVKVKPWSRGVFVAPSESLYKHQHEGAIFCLSRNHSYLGFEMRLGKTATSLSVLNTLIHHKGLSNVTALIIVPPFKLFDWLKDIDRWLKPHNIGTLLLDSRYSFIGNENDFHFHVTLVPDSIFHTDVIQDYLSKKKFNYLIVDEAHRFVNADTIRTDTLFGTKENNYTDGLVRRSKRVTFLSGTPMPNRPVELWPMLRSVAYNTIGFNSFTAYAKEFCDGKIINIGSGNFRKEVFDTSGASNLDKLQKLLKNFMKVEKLSDYAKEIPKHSIVKIGSNGGLPLAFQKFNLLDKTIDEYFEGTIELGDIASYRKELSVEKELPAISYISKQLEQYSDKSFLIFGIHKELLSNLQAKLSRIMKETVYRIDGSVGKYERHHLQEVFQNGGCRILCAQVETMVGIDLYKADRAIFVETPWSPKSIMQASYRLAHLEKETKMFIDHLVLKDSFEEYVLMRALEKLENVGKVIR